MAASRPWRAAPSSSSRASASGRAVPSAAEPILEIVVGEGGSPVKVRYDHRAIDEEPLGWIVENRVLRRALTERLALLPSVRVAAPGEIVRLERGTAMATVELADGTTVQAALVAAAEGRRSSTREAAGIGVRSWSYGQIGLVATFAHPRPHGGMAIERFFPDGPFAMLPMTGKPLLAGLGGRPRSWRGRFRLSTTRPSPPRSRCAWASIWATSASQDGASPTP